MAYIGDHKTSSSVFLALIPASADWTDFQGQGGNEFGFSALPAGYKEFGLGTLAAFWTDELWEDPDVPEKDWASAHLNLSSGEIEWDSSPRDSERSVRCLKDAVVTK